MVASTSALCAHVLKGEKMLAVASSAAIRIRMVGAFEAVSVLFRRKNSLSIVAKIARDHDIFGTSNDLIINHNRPEQGT
jgi:hypothetical protein